MIAVCELNCAWTSHETPNAGFVAALTKCFHGEKIAFYAEKRHLNIVSGILSKKGIDTSMVRFQPVFAAGSHGLPLSLYSCFRVLREIKRNNCDKVLFLSVDPLQEYLCKKLCVIFFKRINCSFVLHGELDNFTCSHGTVTPVIIEKKTLFERLRNKSFFYICSNVWIVLCNILKRSYLRFGRIRLDIRKALLLHQETGRFNHIVLSPFIKARFSEYIDTSKLNIYAIVMPAVFPVKKPLRPINSYLKFGIFGYGNSGLLQRLNMVLAELDIRKKYEIRIIGMDGRGIEDYPNVTHPIPRVLTRDEMEELTQDIDMQMILYEDFRYQLSCSAAIIEAHSYAKPVFYLKNECIDEFNPPEKPIGIRCSDVKEMAEEIHRIVENYDIFQSELQQYYENILFHRERIDIMNNLHVLKEAMSFSI